ncbi:MAG TPA: hexitol phosphatase HxpB [Acidimicrobiales bacterium]|nr:hexitol phosphatase HxpB [Acidimicrobiales bacterium]
MRPDAAIFDMDGLLVDSEPVWHEVEIEVFGRHGVPLTVQRCLETKGMFVGEAVDHWYARYPWRGASRRAVVAEVVDAMARRLAEEVELKAGAGHALAFCRRAGVRLALASSSPRRLIDVVVDRLGLASSFAVVHSAEDEVAGKPDPAVFLTTAGLLGVAPGACVVFEDSAAGVLAAKAAGMACVAVPEAPAGDHEPGVLAALEQADVVLGSLRDLDDEVWEACAAALEGPGGAGSRGLA